MAVCGASLKSFKQRPLNGFTRAAVLYELNLFASRWAMAPCACVRARAWEVEVARLCRGVIAAPKLLRRGDSGLACGRAVQSSAVQSSAVPCASSFPAIIFPLR